MLSLCSFGVLLLIGLFGAEGGVQLPEEYLLLPSILSIVNNEVCSLVIVLLQVFVVIISLISWDILCIILFLMTFFFFFFMACSS